MTGSTVVKFARQLNSLRSTAGQPVELTSPLPFGTVFTDHMVTIRYTDSENWHGARVEPFGPIPMSPATAVLHYGQGIFEGTKAYRGVDGSALLFRPEANARRFRESARRLAMPELPENLFLQSLRELVEVDRLWIPTAADTSLYLRPYLIATEPFLGIRRPAEYLFGVIACPVGRIFASDAAPLRLWISAQYTRAAPGGTGEAKCGGNYAASLLAQVEAVEAGCDQAVFLDATSREYVEELGGMNIFFVHDDGGLVTPALTGTILAGITRDSIITLAREAGRHVEERPYSVDEWRANAASGRLREVFACGTAAAVAPVGVVCSNDGEFTIGDGHGGPVTDGLRAALVDLQRGRTHDRHGWIRRIP
jgi:branched-chain amino acid aminotransferase